MASDRFVTVTLARAWDAAQPFGGDGQIEFAIVLDPHGQPDVDAWLGDPTPWPARRLRPGKPALPGDVAHDDDGWQLRFFPDGRDDPDLPGHRLRNLPPGFRPGEILTLVAPDGEQGAWRIVNVHAKAA